ncbi:MAG: O-antigen ligase family protein, partial [Bacteroidota bacterium]
MSRSLLLSLAAWSLGLWGFFIPLWNLGASLCLLLLVIILIIFYVKEREFPLPKNSLSISFLCFFLAASFVLFLHFQTADLSEFKTLLPFFIGPLFFSNFSHFSISHKKLIWALLLIGTTISLSSSIVYAILHYPLQNPRDASLFISHIRLSLLASTLIFFLLEQSYFSKKLAIPLLILFTTFLVLTATISGFVFLIISGIAWSYFKYKKTILIGIFLLIALPLFFFAFLNESTPLPSCSSNQSRGGETYITNSNYSLSENGFLTYSCIAPEELNRSWKNVSGLDLNSKDSKNQIIQHTLIRYLTSLGLPKDSVGVHSLTINDINNIRAGVTNFEELQWSPLKKRCQQIKFEYQNYLAGGSSAGHSVFQRVIIAGIGCDIVSKNFLWGVGPTQSKELFFRALESNNINPIYSPNKPHNQFLSFWINYGLLGIVAFLVLLFLLFKHAKNTYLKQSSFVFLVSFFCSCLSEDTLNTQQGVGVTTFLLIMFFFIETNYPSTL